MRLLGKVRFSVATVMMLVIPAAACSALFVKAREHIPVPTTNFLSNLLHHLLGRRIGCVWKHERRATKLSS